MQILRTLLVTISASAAAATGRVLAYAESGSFDDADPHSASDTFVKIIGPGGLSCTSPVIDGNNNPSWNFGCTFDPIYAGESITFEVYDQDDSSGDDFLGKQSISAFQAGPYTLSLGGAGAEQPNKLIQVQLFVDRPPPPPPSPPPPSPPDDDDDKPDAPPSAPDEDEPLESQATLELYRLVQGPDERQHFLVDLGAGEGPNKWHVPMAMGLAVGAVFVVVAAVVVKYQRKSPIAPFKELDWSDEAPVGQVPPKDAEASTSTADDTTESFVGAASRNTRSKVSALVAKYEVQSYLPSTCLPAMNRPTWV